MQRNIDTMENTGVAPKKSYWQYISMGDFKAPEASVDRTVKKRVFHFLDILKSGDKKDDQPLISKDETSEIDKSLLDNIAPAPDWQIPAAALDEAIGDWLKSPMHKELFQLILAPPHSGHGKMLTTWADSHQFKIISPPSAYQILHQDQSYLEQFHTMDPFWVIPELEKLFLRHTHGIDLVRHLFDDIFTGKTPPGIIGCDTWAWAFLQHVLKGDFYSILILQAFDTEQMRDFLTDTISKGTENRTVFRQISNGQPIIVSHSLLKSKSKTDLSKSPWIKNMNEYCRGNPGIAIEYWRRSLRTRDYKENSEKPKKLKDDYADENALWVIDWDKLSRPGIPNDLDRDHVRVLYTLLIHGALPSELLYRLLPFSIHESVRFLQYLQATQLIEKSFEIWQVSPYAFPVVRECLCSEGYPKGL